MEPHYRTLDGNVFFASSVSSQHGIPLVLVGALFRYLNDHIQPGSFLRAVLSNDLFLAISYADEDAKRSLPALVGFIHNFVPHDMYGSRELVNNWINRS